VSLYICMCDVRTCMPACVHMDLRAPVRVWIYLVYERVKHNFFYKESVTDGVLSYGSELGCITSLGVS